MAALIGGRQCEVWMTLQGAILDGENVKVRAPSRGTCAAAIRSVPVPVGDVGKAVAGGVCRTASTMTIADRTGREARTRSASLVVEVTDREQESVVDIAKAVSDRIACPMPTTNRAWYEEPEGGGGAGHITRRRTISKVATTIGGEGPRRDASAMTRASSIRFACDRTINSKISRWATTVSIVNRCANSGVFQAVGTILANWITDSSETGTLCGVFLACITASGQIHIANTLTVAAWPPTARKTPNILRTF